MPSDQGQEPAGCRGHATRYPVRFMPMPAQVTALPGRPGPQRQRRWWAVGTERPYPAMVWPVGAWAGTVFPRGGRACRRARPAWAAGRHGATTRPLRSPTPDPEGWRPAVSVGGGGGCLASAGSGLPSPCVARGPLRPQRPRASSIVGPERGGSLRPCSCPPSASRVSVQPRASRYGRGAGTGRTRAIAGSGAQ
jgi:hypothetical protein